MPTISVPKISIIMPVLNRADTIEKAIQSVLAQKYDNFEFIILDGGSTDGTVEIIQRYAEHITYWHSQKDGSAAVATNIGIEKATGDLIALLMADDWYEPGTLHKIAEAYTANPDADILTCAGRIVSYNEQTQLYQTQVVYDSPRQLQLSFYSICYGVSAICFRFIKKSLYARIGLYVTFDKEGKHILTNDKEFLLRAVLEQASNVFVNHLGYTYLAHKESYSFGNQRSSSVRHCIEHRDIAAQYLLTRQLTLPQRVFLIYWYNDQSTRLLLHSLLDKNFRRVFTIVKEGIAKYHIIWPIAFCYSVGQLVISKTLSALK